MCGAGRGGDKVTATVAELDQDLDLTAHTDCACGASDGIHPRPETEGRYRTRAIVCHHGTTLRDGHYTCWVRAAPAAAAAAAATEDSWVHHDDGIVGRPRNTLPPNVPAVAVLRFYERVRDGSPEDLPPGGDTIEIDDADPLSSDFVACDGGSAPAAVEGASGGGVPMSDEEAPTKEPRSHTEKHDEDDPMDMS